MEVALLNLPSSLGFRVTRDIGHGYSSVVPRRCSPSPSMGFRRLPNRCWVRAHAADNSRERNNLSPCLHDFSDVLCKTLPEPVRVFPWKEAESVITHRLFLLGVRVLKSVLLVGFFLSFASDLISSFLRSRELVVPLGLTIGVVVADFLVETAKELVQVPGQLLCVGAVFACAKLLALCVDFPGRMVAAHVSNGGLMQWSADDIGVGPTLEMIIMNGLACLTCCAVSWSVVNYD